MDEDISIKLNKIESQLESLNEKMENISYKVNQAQTEVNDTKEEVKKAKSAAYSADSNASTWFFGILLTAILAFTFNPSISDHRTFLEEERLNPYPDITKDMYKSYWVFSIIDTNGNEDKGTITFGIFGKVFGRGNN
jgi:hypothetical protein